MKQINLKDRTKRFALQVILLVEKIPKGRIADVLSKQLLRAGTSVGANYRAACRARSVSEFIAKMGIVEEEVDETIYWFELLNESKMIDPKETDPLIKEAQELLAITISSIKTARRNKKGV
jgi:four helix bundle protein